jgi:hypothetical protein
LASLDRGNADAVECSFLCIHNHTSFSVGLYPTNDSIIGVPTTANIEHPDSGALSDLRPLRTQVLEPARREFVEPAEVTLLGPNPHNQVVVHRLADLDNLADKLDESTALSVAWVRKVRLE